ncbi:hypothetical protein [Fundidesulfovibrio putealis]|nr:hypothetical protein [Fundidesulfovibrio putealis]
MAMFIRDNAGNQVCISLHGAFVMAGGFSRAIATALFIHLQLIRS